MIVVARDPSKRSLALTAIGAFIILQGLASLHHPLLPADFAVLHEMIPRGLRALLWATTGAVTVVWAWSRHWQWVAVVAAVAMPLERVISYLWSFAHWIIPGPPGGSPWSLVDAGRWAAVVALIVVIAGWVEWDRAGSESADGE